METEKQNKISSNLVLGAVITGKSMDDSYIHKGKIYDISDVGTCRIICGEDCPKKVKYPERPHISGGAIIYRDNILCVE